MRRLFLSACAVVVACSRPAPHSGSINLQDDWHRSLTLAAPARRIVSLAPATTELVFALGLGDRLVGRTTWCDWPAEALLVPSVGNGIGPNVEAIAATHPDLVLVYPSEANRPAVQQLEQLGISAAALKQDAIADFRATVRWVAQAAGVPERADSLLADFDRRLGAVSGYGGAGVRSAGDTGSAHTPVPPSPSVFIAVGLNPPMVIGAGSFVSELVTLAGGRNAFADLTAPSATVSLEAIVARNPDAAMVLGPDSARNDIAMRPGWRAIAAVRAGRIVTVDGSQFNRPSPRLPEAVRELRTKFAALATRP